MNPQISIIIPSFNQAEYLEDAIESCYNQTMSPLEIIVVDDGSTDNSLEIAKRYEFKEFPMIESPVKVISQVNKGLASARNTGIMNARGDYILPLDADDMLKENAIARITKEIIQYNPDIVAPSFKEFGKSDREVILTGFTMEDLKVANRIGYFSAVRRSVLLEVGGYNPKMKWGFEDYDLSFDLFKRGKTIAIIPEVLVMYRVKEASMITTANEHSEELMKQIKINHPNIWQ
jgi:glycosyltransferase involved in cell wall biosynthesis